MKPEWVNIKETQSYMIPDGKFGSKQWAWISECPLGYIIHIPSLAISDKYTLSLMDAMNYIEDCYEQTIQAGLGNADQKNGRVI
jgi:hypothetical protein